MVYQVDASTYLKISDDLSITIHLSEVIKKFEITNHHRISALNGQYGIMALRDIPKDTCFGQYFGGEILQVAFGKVFDGTGEETDHNIYAFDQKIDRLELKKLKEKQKQLDIERQNRLKQRMQNNTNNGNNINNPSSLVSIPQIIQINSNGTLTTIPMNNGKNNNDTNLNQTVSTQKKRGRPRKKKIERKSQQNDEDVVNDSEYDDIPNKIFIIDPFIGDWKNDELLLRFVNDCRADIDDMEPTTEDNKYYNVEFVGMKVNGWPQTYLMAKRDIKKGEELMTYYGADFSNAITMKLEEEERKRIRKQRIDQDILQGVKI